MTTFKFKAINAQEVNNDGSANSNYEQLSVFFNGTPITEVYDCDDNVILNNYILDNRNGVEYEIIQGKVVERFLN